MQKEVAQPKPVYEKPAIQELGTVAQLTLGRKWHSFSDLSQGIGNAISDGGIGS